MKRWTNLTWVILFWAVGAPLFLGGPWLGLLWAAAGSPPSARALWIVGSPAIGFGVMALALYRLVTAAQRSNVDLFATRWLRRYYVEIGAAMFLLMAALLVPQVAPSPSDPLARNLLTLLPVPCVILVVIAISRWVLAGDEYWRKATLENLAAATATTAAWTMSYGYLEHVGLPKLSMFWVWPSLLLAWGTWSVLLRLVRK